MTDQRRTVLITGATGYIGRRLKDRLLSDRRLALRLLVRSARKLGAGEAGVEVVEGDTFDPEALRRATQGVETAYYLIHSMGAGADFEARDRQSAENFREACIASGVKRIVYLGGLGVKATASPHLRSRIETGEILSARPDRIATLWFRAGVIIGSGSASFEIIHHLVHKLPVMVVPRWVSTRTQPIAVDDVLAYLAAALDAETPGNLTVDIGAQAMTFREMLLEAGRAMGLRRWILPVPLLTPRLSSYWLVLFTPVPYPVASALVEGLRSETVLQNDNAARFFPGIHPMVFREAVHRAIDEMETGHVLSRWCDSTPGAACDIRFREDIAKAIYQDRRIRSIEGLAPEAVFESLLSVGGDRGWLSYNPLWRLRGFIDKLAGGPGTARGRRTANELRVGDALDFWKVADLQPGRRLLLLAQMRLPGKAWLEFIIDGPRLVQTAYFYPRGLLGRLYWYAMLPFHHLVFNGLVDAVVRGARPDPG